MTPMTPFWLDRPRATHPTLTAPASYDVVVAGAGAVGLLTGLLLARAGRRVAVLEARQVGDGTTGHTTAKISLLQGTRLSRALRTNPPSVVRDYVAANQEGQEWLRQFCGTHDVPYQDRPAFTYATSRHGELRVRAELAAAKLIGLEATWEEKTELPYDIRGAVRLADQMQLDAGDLLGALVAELLTEGGELFEHTRVTDAHPSSGGVKIETDHASLDARHLVLATGQPFLRRHGFFARTKPQRSYAAAFRSPWVPDGMYLSADRETKSLRSLPVAGGSELLLVGGNGHITGREASEEGRLEDLVAWTVKNFGGELTHTWSAQDFATVTGLPYVGPMLPGQAGTWVATGFDKWGLAAAPAAALLLTKSILAEGGAGERPPWHRAFSSWTPREAVGIPRAAVFNAGVGIEMTKDVVRRRWREAEQAEPPLRGICTHLGGAVRWNDAEHSWDCPLHGSRFDTDGAVLEGPAVCGLRKL
jgi:glycine/D-amino acid oxidase-like deaminating enzyme